MKETRRFVSVGGKLTVATFALMALSTAAVYVGLSRFAREQLTSAKEEGARKAGQLFLRQASTPVIFDDATGLGDTVALLGQDHDVLGVELWRAAAGHVGARLAVQLGAGAAGVAPRWVAAPAIERHPDRIVFRDAVHDREGNIIAVAAVQYSLAREQAAFATLRRRILAVAAGVAIVLSLLLLAVSRRWIVAPLGRLLEAVKRVEEGGAVELGRAHANDEVGRLAAAFDRMADAVARRERDIARRNQDMRLVLDNVEQGFLVIDGAGRLAAEHSAIVARWFGPPAAGQSVVDYLAPVDGNAAALLGLGLEGLAEAVLPVEVTLGQLPERLRRGERHFACVYHLVDGEAHGRQLVLVISDVTAEVEHERVERAQRDLMAALSRMMADKASFVDSMHEAHELVAQVIADEQLTPSAALRHLHTLKGVAAMLGFDGIAELCHRLEERALEEQRTPSADERAGLRAQWEWLAAQLDRFGGGGETTAIARHELDALVAAAEAGAAPGELLAALARLYDHPVLPRLQQLGDYARTLATQLGKAPVAVELDGGAVRLPPEPWHRLWPALTHLLRNAIDHGVESEDERRAAGKPPVARVQLTAGAADGTLAIVVGDDGRGIDWDALAARAADLAIAVDGPDERVAALFADGVSTRDGASATSGRGVGLAAVRQTVESLGGAIEVDSRVGQGTRFVLRFPLAARAAAPGAVVYAPAPVILRTDATS